MAKYKVSLEIDLDAPSPIEAAELARQWAIEDPMQYYVQDMNTRIIYSVDLAEPDEDAVLPVDNYEPFITPK